MARIRSVHPELFLDDAFMELSPHARLLAIGIWTQCDDHGIFEWKPNYFKATILPVDTADIPVLLEALQAQNCIKRFEEDGRTYGAVRNFCLFQRPKRPLFKLPFPDWCRTYVALDRRKAQEVANQTPSDAPPVTPSSPTDGEKSPHRRGEKGREGEGENLNQIENPVVVVPAAPETTTTTDLKSVDRGKKAGTGSPLGKPLPSDWTPDDATCDKALADFGMTIEDINAELPAFHALNLQNGTLSQNWSATFYLFAKQWKARAARAAPRVELSKAGSNEPVVMTDALWETAVKFYGRTGRWNVAYGPEPISPACRCPVSILEKHLPNPDAIPVVAAARKAVA